LGMVLLALPVLAKPFYLAWYAIACAVGLVVSNILVAALFFLVVTPIGRLLRMMGWSHFRTAPDSKAATYWQEAETVSDPKRYYSQF